MSSYILKLAGTSCNIDCTYCNEKSKALVYNENLTIKYISKLFEDSNDNEKIDILLHGGEPLIIGFQKIKNLLELLRANHDKLGYVKVQTNGTLLNKKWFQLFFEDFQDLKIDISISLDGDSYLNYLRVDYQNKDTTTSVENVFLLAKQYNKKIGVLSVINKLHINNTQRFVSYFEKFKENILFLKFNPLYTSREELDTATNITPSEYTYFLQRVYQLWIEKNLYKNFVIEPIISYIQSLKGIEDRKYCEFQKNKPYKCFEFNTIYPNGDIAPCDTLSINDFKVGNIFNNSIQVEEKNFFEQKHNLKIIDLMNSKCEACEIKELCGGGCLAQRKMFFDSYLYEEYCTHRKEMFHFMEKELR
jgi:uncharacterized protein